MNQIIIILDQTLIFIMALFIPWLWLGKQKLMAVKCLLSGLIAWGTALIIKNYFYTARPYIAKNFNPIINNPPTDGSFPSGHTATAFAIATVVFIVNRKFGYLAYLIATLVGLMRVLGGVHYWIDIVGGMAIGFGVSYIVYKLNILDKFKLAS